MNVNTKTATTGSEVDRRVLRDRIGGGLFAYTDALASNSLRFSIEEYVPDLVVDYEDVTEAPVIEAPVIEAPVIEAPVIEAPVIEPKVIPGPPKKPMVMDARDMLAELNLPD